MWDKIWFYIVDFFIPFLKDLGLQLLKIGGIIIVMLIIIEILKALKILDFINKILFFFTKPLGISKNASMPLLIGLLAGITYGAGALLTCYNNGLTKKDLILVSIFLCICHGIVEDTLLFVSSGANGLIILVIRFVLAIIITLITNILMKINNKKKVAINNN